jgi:hypothetical protein
MPLSATYITLSNIPPSELTSCKKITGERQCWFSRNTSTTDHEVLHLPSNWEKREYDSALHQVFVILRRFTPEKGLQKVEQLGAYDFFILPQKVLG